MSDNYSGEIKPLLKLLRTPAFRFIIVCYNHYNPVRRLEKDIRQHFPDRPFFKTNAQKTNYQTISRAYFELGEGFFWIENFDDVLDEERNSLGQETPKMVQNNERRRHITAGLNLRRDKLATLPIALFVLVPASHRELYVRSIMKKMPDLWSFRSMIVDLSIDLTQLPRIPQEIQSLDLLPGFENTTLGGETIEEKQAELERLTTALSSVPEHEQAYRNTLIQQINELNRYIEGVTKGIASATNVHFGDVIPYSGDRPIPRALTKAPFFPETFLGREADLRRIRERLVAPGGNFLLLVNGEGGIGKTTLASKYYHEYQHEYVHTAWLLSEKSIANALLLLADPLGLQFDERMDTEGRLDILLTAMADLEKPCLLVLDSANELPDLEANYQALQRLSNFHLLLTTRISNFEKAEMLSIDGLPEAEALGLFEGYYRPLGDEERALFFQIWEAVGGNTLVIELLAQNLALFNKLKTNYALSALLADLQEKGLLRLTRSQEVHTDYQSKAGQMRREKPQDIIAAMYDLGELPREEVALLSVFAVLPAESIGFETLETLLQGLENLETNLLALAQKGWIEYNETKNTFKCSPVVQEIVRRKNRELRADCQVLVDALNEKLEYEGGTGHFLNATYAEALHFVRYAEAVFSNLPEPDWNFRVLTDRIGSFHQTTGNLEQALSFYEASMQVNKLLCASEPGNEAFKNGLAISYSNLGSTQSALGNLEQALTFFEQYSQLKKELYEAYPQNMAFKNGLAISYGKLGSTQSALGNLEQALTFFEQYSQLEKELYEAYPQNVAFKNGLAISYSKLGETQSALGNLEQALTYFEQCNHLEKELYEAYPQNVAFKNSLAISYERLGNTQSELGNLEQALTFFEQYNYLERKLYEAYPQNVAFKNGLAISYSKLGLTQRALGNLEQALTFFELSLKLMKELYEAYTQNVAFKNGLAISYQYLGITQRELGNLEQALTFLEQYNLLEKELYEAYPQNVEFKNNLASSYSMLGETQSALGNLEQALTFFESFTNLMKELYEAYPQNVAFKNGLAVSYSNLGIFYRDQKGDKAKTSAYFQQCYALWEALSKAYPAYIEFKKNFNWAKNALEEMGE